MSATNSVLSTSGLYERLWRTAGIQFAGLFVVAYALYGYQPGIGATADELTAFYGAFRAQTLVAAVLAGMAILSLMWFAAAIRNTLADAGRDGWGMAITAASAVLGGLFLLFVTVSAALTYSVAGSGNVAFASGLNVLSWVCIAMTSFPRAMLVTAIAFGLRSAGLVSNALFGAGVAAGVLLLLGGTTLLGSGVWAPDGTYARFVTPAVDIFWILAVSRVLLSRTQTARAGW